MMNADAIEDELRDLKVVLNKLLAEKETLSKSIKEAEIHILKEEKLNFWEPKLLELRNDKSYLNSTETQLREQILIRERLQLMENGELNYSPDGKFPAAERRPRGDTWTADNDSNTENPDAITEHKYNFTIAKLSSDNTRTGNIGNEYKALHETAAPTPTNTLDNAMKKSPSSPAILAHHDTAFGQYSIPDPEADKIVVKDFVKYSGEFNVFGVNSGEDEEEEPASMDDRESADANISRENTSASARAPTPQTERSSPIYEPQGLLSMSGILNAIGSRALDSFRFAESLVITQTNDDDSDDDDDEEEGAKKGATESSIVKTIEHSAVDSFKFAESLVITQTNDDDEDNSSEDDEARDRVQVPVECLSSHSKIDQPEPRRKMLGVAPNVSNHDFSVFGVDLSDEEEA